MCARGERPSRVLRTEYSVLSTWQLVLRTPGNSNQSEEHPMATITDVETQHLTSHATVELFKKYVIGNYNRYPVNLVRGEGSLVWDSEGNRYLDFFPGWGCNLLGHCPPHVVRAVQDQVATLIHVPTTWHMDGQGHSR